jgi:hypothetical protein
MPCACRHVDDPVVLVDDVDELLPVLFVVLSSGPVPRAQEMTYHAAMTVETLREEAKDLHDDTVRLRRQLTNGRRSATSCP